MSKVAYLLINSATGKFPTPLAVCGRNKTYGHALHEPEFNAHVYRVTEEQWLGGMDRDIAEGGHRSLQKWIVRAEFVPEEVTAAETPAASAEDEQFAPAVNEENQDGDSETGGDNASGDATDSSGEFAGLKFRAIRKIAKDEGVDTEGANTSAELIERIEHQRELKAAIAAS